MQIVQDSFTLETRGRGSYALSHQVEALIGKSGIRTGTAQVFTHHTSASLMLTENADPDVRRDLETFMSALVPDADPRYRHRDEGPDDMAAHVRSVLTQSGLCFPITAGKPGLGVWQGIYLWEHRHAAHRRKITVTLMGSAA